MFIDLGSSMDIIYKQCFKQHDLEDKARLEPVDFPLTGFCNEVVFPLGQIAFPVTLSDGEHSQTVTVNFMVMPATSRHDVLLGRRSQREFSMITSIPHDACGFPTETRFVILYSSKEVMYVDDEPPTKNLEANVDSKLVAEQVNGHYDAKGEAMALYLEQARMLISQFQTFKINHINRSENKHADALMQVGCYQFQTPS
ncbi:putative ribonuclease H domain, aspartic peptidase domain superfamily, ribonuclease H superfamily [Helianthus anomalus]